MSKLSELVRALIDGTEVEIVPTTKAQTYLVACINGTGSEGCPEPTTVLGGLLCELADKLAGGGGGGGSTALKIIECDERGYATDVKFTGSALPNNYFWISQWNDSTSPVSCILLKNVELSEGLKSIGTWCFYDQKFLSTVTIPSTVESIALYAFRDCSTLKTIYFKGQPTTINANAFYGVKNADIYVPWASGAVSGSPWGATNATIHYNWTPEE